MSEHPIPFERRTNLPLPLCTARVEAGFPSPADDHMERMLDLNEELVHNPVATFFVRVQGHSMKDAGIHPGDISRLMGAVHGWHFIRCRPRSAPNPVYDR